MFKNYLTIAIRNLLQHKVYTFINLIAYTAEVRTAVYPRLDTVSGVPTVPGHGNHRRIHAGYRVFSQPAGRIDRRGPL